MNKVKICQTPVGEITLDIAEDGILRGMICDVITVNGMDLIVHSVNAFPCAGQWRVVLSVARAAPVDRDYSTYWKGDKPYRIYTYDGPLLDDPAIGTERLKTLKSAIAPALIAWATAQGLSPVVSTDSETEAG